MRDSWSRRRLLAAAGTVGIGSLAGCGMLPTDSREPLPVEIANFTTETQYLDVELVRRDATDLSAGTALSESYELEPSEAGEEEYTVPELPTVPNRPYTVRANLGGRALTRHYHYVPDCVGVETHDDRLYVWVESSENGVTISFDQNGCQ